jgi:hypothetical protein
MARFILQLEIEAPINSGNANFPKEVYAIEALCDHLKEATLQRLEYIMMSLSREKGEETAANRHFIEAQNQIIASIKKIYPTIKCVEIIE